MGFYKSEKKIIGKKILNVLDIANLLWDVLDKILNKSFNKFVYLMYYLESILHNFTHFCKNHVLKINY